VLCTFRDLDHSSLESRRPLTGVLLEAPRGGCYTLIAEAGIK
jgi:hypothetical protein